MLELINYIPAYESLIDQWHHDQDIRDRIGANKPYRRGETFEVLNYWAKDKARLMLMAKHNDKIIGYVMLESINQEYGSCMLHTVIGEKEFIGKKVCVEVIDEILDIAFNKLDMYRVSTFVLGDNQKLIDFGLKYGWVEEGNIRGSFINRLGNRVDYRMFGILKTEFKRRVS